MRASILYPASYALASVQLEQGEQLRMESGAMVGHSPTIEIEAKMEGGFLKSLGRAVLGGESFFITRATANTGPGEILLAPSAPGDIVTVPLNGGGLIVQRGCYLANSTGVEVDTKWGGFKGAFTSGGFFWLHLHGQGAAFVASFGAIHRRTLAPGEHYIVDTGHIVAFSDTIQYQVRKAAKGFLNTATTGEWLVAEYVGPGELLMQTRQAPAFAQWMAPYLPTKGSS
ncbi:MAG: TIGR00266 family protein [Candidatus Brocadiae bacterium]|nr:TIGR00266 family protein [Candidatus Brocadiia bacterium]